MSQATEVFLGAESALNSPPPILEAVPDTSNPYYGVKGWLKFLVVVNLYIAPILFGLSQILVWIGCAIVAEEHPGIIPVCLIELLVGGFLVVRAILVARDLRDIRPRAVQNAKSLLLLCLAWTFLDIPVALLSGLEAESLLPGILKQIFTGVLSFSIWYSYFNVSKRVRATYPGWKD